MLLSEVPRGAGPSCRVACRQGCNVERGDPSLCVSPMRRPLRRWLHSWLVRDRVGTTSESRLSRLLLAMSEGGCCICMIAATAEERSFRLLLWESVSDPQTRREMRDSMGLCPLHAYRLFRVGRDVSHDALGLAMLFRDQFDEVGERLTAVAHGRRDAASTLDATVGCPACVDRRRRETEYLGELLARIDDDHVRTRYLASEGLCRQHLEEAPDSLPRTDAGHRGRPSRDAHRGALPPRRRSLSAAGSIGRSVPLEDQQHPRTCVLCQQQHEAERERLTTVLRDGARASSTTEDEGPSLCRGHRSWMDPAAREPATVGNAPIESPRAECTVCRHGWATVFRVTRGLCERAPNGPLCVPHLRLLGPLGVLGPALAETQAQYHFAVRDELAKFIRLADWTKRHEAKGAEQRSWLVAAALLYGPGENPPDDDRP